MSVTGRVVTKTKARQATPLGTAVTTSVVATVLVGGAALTVAYRLFQGPGTNQLFLIWGWANAWWLALGSPVALALGAVTGWIAARMHVRRHVRLAYIAGCALSHALAYSLLGWLAAELNLGSLFELRRQLIPVSLITGALVGSITAWRAARVAPAAVEPRVA